MENIITPIPCNEGMSGSYFSWTSFWWLCLCLNNNIVKPNLCHTLDRCKVPFFNGKLHDSYSMQWRKVREPIFMDKLLILMLIFNLNGAMVKPMSYIEQMQGSLFSLKTSWHIYHAMKECQVVKIHGQASDSYAYMMNGSLFSWIRLWNLCHTLNRCKVAYFHGKK